MCDLGRVVRVLANSVVGTSGVNECENPVVVLVVFLGGLFNIGQVSISVCCRRTRTPARRGSTFGEVSERPSALATPDEEEAAQAARSGMVAVLTPDWDSNLMSGKEEPLCDGLTEVGPSGPIDDVPGSDGIEIHSFHTVRGEPHVSKLQKSTEPLAGGPSLIVRKKKAGARPHTLPLPRSSDLLPVAEVSSEITDTAADDVWVIGEDGQAFPASTIVRPPHGGHVVHGHMLRSVLRSLLELVHRDTVESCAHRLRSRGKSRADTPASTVQPQDGRTNDGTNEFIAELGGKQNLSPAADTLENDNEGDARLDARVPPITGDKAVLRQRTFATTRTETSWEDWPITGPRTFLGCVRFILTHYTSPEAQHTRCLFETKLDSSASRVSEHSGIMRIIGFPCATTNSKERNLRVCSCWPVGLR